MTMTSKPEIEFWAVADLKPYPKNAKRHSPDQVAKLAKSIGKLGWTALIVIDRDGVIITGHGRRLAAIHMGAVKVPVICRRDLSPEEADALRLADNRISSTDYDQGLLQEELARLAADGFEMEVMGFDARELDFLTADLAEVSASMFVDDVSEAVEDQKRSNAEKVAAVEESDTPVGEALGFKRVTVRQSRRIKAFIAALEEETGETGIEALLAHIEDVVTA